MSVSAEPSLHLRQWGEGRVVCLLLHGTGEGGYVWNPFASLLEPHCRVVASDLRGHADSQWAADGAYDIEAHVSDIMRLIDTFRWRRVILIGHSCGADISIRLAARRKDCVAAMVLVDFAPEIDPESLRWSGDQFRDLFREYADADEFEALLRARRSLASPVQLRHIAANALRPSGTGKYILKHDPALKRNDYDLQESVLWKELARITCPTLIVRGVGSALVTRAGVQRMKKVLRQARVVEVAMAGHDVMTDNAAGFAAAVLPFVLGQIGAKTG